MDRVTAYGRLRYETDAKFAALGAHPPGVIVVTRSSIAA
jgi:hypothetical protein